MGLGYNQGNMRVVTQYYKHSRYRVVCGGYWIWDSTVTTYSPSLINSSNGDAFCKAKFPSKKYYKSATEETSDWTTDTYRYGWGISGYAYSFQTYTVKRKVYGGDYYQTGTPSTGQNYLGYKMVPVYTSVITNYIHITQNDTPIGTSDMLTENDVNGKVATYTSGEIDSITLIRNGQDLLEASYWGLYPSRLNEASNTANNNFREGNF